MKRIVFIIVFFVTISVFKITAQTTIPFYGYEASFEIGDSIEFSDYQSSCPDGYYWYKKRLCVFISKVVIDSTLFYTVRQVQKAQQYNQSGFVNEYLLIDTFPFANTNEPLIDSNQYIFPGCMLSDSISANGYFIFDTINGLKYVKMDFDTTADILRFEAYECRGVTNWYSFDGCHVSAWSQIYASLQHCGIFGDYEPIYLSTESIVKQNDLVVTYNNENKTLQVKSHEHLNGLIKLYDVLGRCVLSSDINEKEFYVGNLTEGIYFYSINGRQTSSGKILIR